MKRPIIVILVILIAPIVFILSDKFVKRVDKESKNTQVIAETPQPQKDFKISLKDTVENVLLGKEGTYGIFIKNLKTGESYAFNEHKNFEPGSLYKIWILAVTFNEIENGRLKENQILSQEIAVLNEKFHISSESAELTEGQITLSAKEAMEQMITISDNYSALLLSEKVRFSTVKIFLQKNDFNESFLGEPPQTTPYDIALFFEKLYKGELANQENTDKMLSLFKKQRLNSKLPKYLPKETIIAHKTGEIGYFSHDAGIVYTPNGDYVIAILSKSEAPDQANEQIAEISKKVYDYFVSS